MKIFRLLAASFFAALLTIGCSSSNEEASTAADGDESNSIVIEDSNTINDDNNASETTEAELADVTGESGVDSENNTALADITQANTNELILQAFDVLTGRAYDKRLTVFPYTQIIEVPSDYGVDLTNRWYSLKECDNAGQISKVTNLDNGLHRVQGVYSDCLVGADKLNGTVEIDQGYGEVQFQRHYQNDFSVQFEPNGRMAVSGLYQYLRSESFQRIFNVLDFNYEFDYPGGRLKVSDANTNRSSRIDGLANEFNQTAFMSGSFHMQPPFLNGSEVFVETLEDFTNEVASTHLSYERGVMRISSSSGEVLLNADNGNKRTVSITVALEGATPVTKEEPWSVWMNALAFVPPGLSTTMPPDAASVVTTRSDVIREDNYRAILSEVLNVNTGELFGADILALPGYPLPEYPSGLAQPGTPDGLGEQFTQSCANGGSVDLRTFKFGARQITLGWNADFNQCAQDDTAYDGSFRTRQFGNFNYWSDDGITIGSPDRQQQFVGGLSYKWTPNRDGGPGVFYYFSGDYESRTIDSDSGVQAVESEHQILGASVWFSVVGPYQASMNGRYFLKTPVTENEMLQVAFLDPFVIDNDDFMSGITHYRWGTLLVIAGNGNNMLIEVDNENEQTFKVTLNQANGTSILKTENWSDWSKAYSFVFDLHTR